MDIARLMPNIVTFATSGGAQAQDFYVAGVDQTYAYAGVPPLAPSLAVDHDPVDLSCVGPGGDPRSPGTSCETLLRAGQASGDGLYWVNPTGQAQDLLQVYCDMSTDGGGWALALRQTGPARSTHPDPLGAAAAGPSPLLPDATGLGKLSDAHINGLVSGAVPNAFRVVIRAPGYTQAQGKAWHPATCRFDVTTNAATSSACALSTQGGPSSTAYARSGHPGILPRWYVGGATFGSGAIQYLIFNSAGTAGTHISPVSNGERAFGSITGGYCTYYDTRTCPMDSALEVWVR